MNCSARRSWIAAPGILLTLVVLFLSPRASAQNVSPAGVEEEAKRAERERRQREEQAQRTRRLVQQCVDQAQTASDLLERLQKRWDELSARLEALETNDDGKKIAQDSAGSMVYLQLVESPILTPEQLASRRKAINSILTGLKEELKRENVDFLPDPATQGEVAEIHFWAKERLGLILEKTNWLDASLANAPRDLELSKLKTLRQFRQDYDATKLAALARARATGEAQAKAEAERKVTDSAREAELQRAAAEAERLLKEARAEIAAMRAEFETQMKERETEQQRRVADAEKRYQDELAQVRRELELAKAERDKADVEAKIKRDAVAAEARKKELMQKAEDPVILNALAPFTTKGYWQPGVARGKAIDLIPVSLSKLRSIGALSPGADGLQKLLTCGTNEYHKKGHDHVRPRWPYPPLVRDLKPEQLEELKKAQGYLIELGDVLVEKGLLSP